MIHVYRQQSTSFVCIDEILIIVQLPGKSNICTNILITPFVRSLSSPHPRYRRQSRDSVHSDSTIRSPTPSISRSRSRSHSQSSFTSIERSEIRQIIKNIKCNETQSVESVSRSSSVPPAPPIHNLTPVTKPKRSLVTEELDREFNKLRALIPDQELTYVTPSSFCKRKKSTGKGPAPLPPLPTFSELLRKVQLRPVDKSALTVN